MDGWGTEAVNPSSQLVPGLPLGWGEEGSEGRKTRRGEETRRGVRGRKGREAR